MFGPTSFLTKRRIWSGSKLFDKVCIKLKEFYEKTLFVKRKLVDDKRTWKLLSIESYADSYGPANTDHDTSFSDVWYTSSSGLWQGKAGTRKIARIFESLVRESFIVLFSGEKTSLALVKLRWSAPVLFVYNTRIIIFSRDKALLWTTSPGPTEKRIIWRTGFLKKSANVIDTWFKPWGLLQTFYMLIST